MILDEILKIISESYCPAGVREFCMCCGMLAVGLPGSIAARIRICQSRRADALHLKKWRTACETGGSMGRVNKSHLIFRGEDRDASW